MRQTHLSRGAFFFFFSRVWCSGQLRTIDHRPTPTPILCGRRLRLENEVQKQEIGVESLFFFLFPLVGFTENVSLLEL